MLTTILLIIINVISSVMTTLHIDVQNKQVGNVFNLPWAVEAKTVDSYSMWDIDASFRKVNVNELNAYIDLYNSLSDKVTFTWGTDYTKEKWLIKVDTKSIGLYKEVIPTHK